MTVLSAHLGVASVVGSDFSDPTNERLIYLSAVGLFVIGAVLLVFTILWWRRGRQEHPALAPLEVLGSRAWAKADEVERRRRIEQVRVGGSAVVEDQPDRPEPVDLRDLVRNMPDAFDDLREPAPAEAAVVPEPAAPEATPDNGTAADPDVTVAAPRPSDESAPVVGGNG